MQKEILVIGNNLESCKKIKYNIQDTDTRVYYTLKVYEGLREYFKKNYCLVILDVSFTEEKGKKMLTYMREKKTTPILIVTSKKDNGLEMLKFGADDYITKPFEIEECKIKTLVLIRRYVELKNKDSSHYITIVSNRLIVDPSSREVYLDGKLINFTQKEFDLLYLLVKNQGKVFTREQIYNLIWNQDFFPYDNSVRCLIKRIRQKLKEITCESKFIHTKHGIGYFFKDYSVENI